MKTTLSDELVKTLSINFEKNEVRGSDQIRVIRWAEEIIMGSGILANINAGLMEVVGLSKDGAPLFQLTEAGRERVEKLIGKNDADQS